MIRCYLCQVWLLSLCVQAFGQTPAGLSIFKQFACEVAGGTVVGNTCVASVASVASPEVSFLKSLQASSTIRDHRASVVDAQAFLIYQQLAKINSYASPYFSAFYGPVNRPHVMDTYAFSQQVILNQLGNIWQFCEQGVHCSYTNVSILGNGIGLGTTPFEATICALDAKQCTKSVQSQRTPIVTDQSACFSNDQKDINQCLLRQLEHKNPPCAQSRTFAPSTVQASTKLYSLLSFANVLTGSCANDYSPFITYGSRTANVADGTLMDMSNPCALPWAVTGQGCSFSFAALHNADKTRVWNGMHGLLENNGLLLSLRDALQRDTDGTLVGTSDKQAIACLIDAAERIYTTVVNTCAKAYTCTPYSNLSSPDGVEYTASVSDLEKLTGSMHCKGVLENADTSSLLNAKLASGAAGRDLGAGIVMALASFLDDANTNALKIMERTWREDFNQKKCTLSPSWLSTPADVSSMVYLQATPTFIASTATESFSPGNLQNAVANLKSPSNAMQDMQSTSLYKIKYDFIMDLLQLKSSYFFPVWELLIQQPTSSVAINTTCANSSDSYNVEVKPGDQMIFVRNGRIMHYVNTRKCMGEGLADSFGSDMAIAFKLPSVLPKAQALQHTWTGHVKQMVEQKIRLWSQEAIYKSMYSDALARQAIRRNASMCSGEACQSLAYSDIQRGVVQLAQGDTSLSEGVLATGKMAVMMLARTYFNMYEQYEQYELDLLIHLLRFSNQYIDSMNARYEILDATRNTVQNAHTGVDA